MRAETQCLRAPTAGNQWNDSRLPDENPAQAPRGKESISAGLTVRLIVAREANSKLNYFTTKPNEGTRGLSPGDEFKHFQLAAWIERVGFREGEFQANKAGQF